MTGRERACVHASPHLIVQIHEVPLEVMGENVVLASAAKNRKKKGNRRVRKKKKKVTILR